MLFFNISAQLPSGQDLPLPPVILGELGKDPQNPTVCFYGHVDVQPAKKEDGWKTDPYTLTEIDGVYLVISFVSLFEYTTDSEWKEAPCIFNQSMRTSPMAIFGANPAALSCETHQ